MSFVEAFPADGAFRFQGLPGARLRLMDKILHDPKDPKLWELWYIPYYGSCRILSINRRVLGWIRITEMGLGFRIQLSQLRLRFGVPE